jgi:hypothetical protein
MPATANGAVCRRRAGLTADFQAHVTVTRLMHKLGHFPDDGKHVEGSLGERNQSRVELRDVAELSNKCYQTGARLLRIVDHLSLPVGERIGDILLQHPQIAADHARRRPKFVHSKRKQLRILFGLCHGSRGAGIEATPADERSTPPRVAGGPAGAMKP